LVVSVENADGQTHDDEEASYACDDVEGDFFVLGES
jgi:hypothetical protein